MAGEIGLVGGSIEDATGNPQKPLFDAGLRGTASPRRWRRRAACRFRSC